MKPKILVCVLCGPERTGWINPMLFEALQALLFDGRLSVLIDTAYGIDRVEVARNRCVTHARNRGADFLVMCDNDMVPPQGFAEALLKIAEAGKPVVSFPSARVLAKDGSVEPLTPQDNGTVEGPFRQTGLAGAGIMVISSEVWRVIPRGPWFRWLVADDELLSRTLSEDYAFCELVQQHGLGVWSYISVAGHLKTADITRFL